jgi:ankyrin repeat protein
VVRVLLEHGADPTIRNNEGRTPLELGRKCGNFVEELMLRSSKTTVYDK